MKSKNTAHIVSKLAVAALAIAGFGLNAQTTVNVNINELPTNNTTLPTYNAGNASATFAETIVSSTLTAALTTVNTSQSTVIQNLFNSAVTALNGNSSVSGSALNVQAARVALDAAPSNTTLQGNYDRALSEQSRYLVTVNQLRPLVTVANNTTVNSHSGLGSTPVVTQNVTAGVGTLSSNVTTAQGLGSAISNATAYFAAGAGASNSTLVRHNLESAVIVPIRNVNAANNTVDANSNGFLDADETAHATANTTYAAALANYTATLANNTATATDLNNARAALATAEAAFASAVATLYANFAPITATAKDNLLATVLNGSWERNALASATADIVALEVANAVQDTRLTAVETRATNLETRATALEAAVLAHSAEIQTIRQGVAMAAALQTPVIGHGKNNAVKLGVAVFDGETGIAGGYARRINDELTVNIEFASTDDFDETIVRGGLNYTW